MSSVIVDWRRTPFSRSHKGELSEVRPDEFASQVLVELLNNLNIDPAEIDDVIVGCAYPEGEQGYNIGRLMALMSGLPQEAPGVTINRLCGSSMQAIMYASANISAGWGMLRMRWDRINVTCEEKGIQLESTSKIRN